MQVIALASADNGWLAVMLLTYNERAAEQLTGTCVCVEDSTGFQPQTCHNTTVV